MENIGIYNYASIGKLIEKAGAKTMLVHIPFKFIEDAVLILGFEDFLSFLCDNQILQVFIHEEFIEPEDFCITEETFRILRVEENKLECLQKSIEDYNRNIENANFEFPETVIAFFIWNGQRFYHIFQNDIMVNGEVLISAEDKLTELIMFNEESILEANDAKRKVIEKQKEDLKLQIMGDPEFKVCTNKRLRRNYIIGVFEKSTVPKELKGFWVNRNGLLYQGAFDFVETIWREVKG